jgi:hypothetical protein
MDVGTTKDSLQNAWFAKNWKTAMKDKYSFTTDMYDTHEHPLPGGLRPDCVHVSHGLQPSEYSVVVVGDLVQPEGGSTSFKANSRGKILDFCRCCKAVQTFRQQGVYGYVCDGNKIQFYYYKSAQQIYQSPIMDLDGNGGLWLLGLLSKSDYGYKMKQYFLNGHKIVVEKFLGKGAMGTVFECHCTGYEDICAVKITEKPENHVFLEREKEYIDFLQAKLPATVAGYVISCRGLADPDPRSNQSEALVVHPIGQDLTRLVTFPGYTRAQLFQLIDLVREIHNLNLIHRDIRPSNILLQRNGIEFNILLTDFGTMVSADGAVIPYHGTSKFASQTILQALASPQKGQLMLVARKEDDIESIKKIIYVSIIRHAYKELQQIRFNNYQEIFIFWENRLNTFLWNQANTYEGLKSVIDNLGFQS